MINRVGGITNSIGVLYKVWSCYTIQVFLCRLGYYIKFHSTISSGNIIEIRGLL